MAIERVNVGDVREMLAAIVEAAVGGATGIEVVGVGSRHPLDGRMPADASMALAAALDEPVAAGLHLRIDAGEPLGISRHTLDLAAAREVDLVFVHDPIAAFAAGGGTASGVEAATNALAALAVAFDERDLTGAVVLADGRLWNAGGATDEQELAATLATFVTLLRTTGAAAGRIDVALAADTDQFRTTAKFRAMRLLLARVGEIAGLSSPIPRIHAETAWRTMSARHPETNILRATSASFGAAAGGADSITVLPFDALGGGDGHGRRLARNTQIILSEEANLFRVADPAAGSGAIEAMTASLAEGAWRRFQAIETQGGIVEAISEGSLLREVAEAREARLALAAGGPARMIGVNAYTGNDTPPPERVRRVPVEKSERLVFKRLSESLEPGLT